MQVFEKPRAWWKGSSIIKSGHRFDLGPTIITLPNMFRNFGMFVAEILKTMLVSKI